ncbi:MULTISPECIES: hypothetical protein [unclassified Streptomyces]|uniref:hypothetical protein n=1 Tax=unclassified Streptomyces TaxID=2593676 RepID=UPI0029AA7EF3|nr:MULTISPECIES: hypothetical protein [unclassified Streptomyces]MDX3772338.1 hypothetical protein [Streptomyces sp. AK08-01B]MDX3821204.1 hypothetical protein [Streptomyces sp. AK08-01A]
MLSAVSPRITGDRGRAPVGRGMMSFDLAVWFEQTRPSRVEAVQKHRRMCEGGSGVAVGHLAVAMFHGALVAEFPEVPHPVSPWSAGLDVSEESVLMPMAWGRVAEVAPRVVELAGEHGLVCFDPQAGVVHVPPGLRGPDALQLQSCVGLQVEDPDPETVERAVRRLSAENWFVILEGSPDRYVQVGTGSRAGVASGGFGVEHRDGSPDRHYRCVLRDLDQVVAVFADFARGTSAWSVEAKWEKLSM